DELRVLRELLDLLLVHTLRAHLRLRSGEGRADDGDVAVLTHLLGIDLVVALRRGGVAVCSARTALPAGVAVRWSVAVTTVARLRHSYFPHLVVTCMRLENTLPLTALPLVRFHHLSGDPGQGAGVSV